MALGDGIRRNIAYVDPGERALLVDALIELNKRKFPGDRTDLPTPGGVTSWFKQDEIHQATHVHHGPEFLPWHREIVNRLEEMLREIHPELSLHYWDWTQDPTNIQEANIGNKMRGPLNLFTPDFMGYGGPTSERIGPPWQNTSEPWRPDGFYVPGVLDANRNPANREITFNPADPPAQVRRFIGLSPFRQNQVEYDNNTLNQSDYAQMRRFLETSHDYMHGFVFMGGQHISFRDPFVFLLHSNVDRLFARWQTDPTHPERLDPNQLYGSESDKDVIVQTDFGPVTQNVTHIVEPWSTGTGLNNIRIRPWSEPGQGEPHDYKHYSVVTPPRYDTNYPALQIIQSFFSYNGGWRVDQHPRFLADLTGDGRADIVGFGEDGVWISLNNGNGSFQAPQLAVPHLFGHGSTLAAWAGGWLVDQHPRLLADLTGNGRADIVGIGVDGVFVALSNGDGTFQGPNPQPIVENFGYNANAGGWRVDQHPRFLSDVIGNGRADIVGFGNDGVWVSLGNGNGTFQTPQLVIQNFGYNGGWRVDQHPRLLADVTGNGRADIVGFGNDGVWVSFSNGDGTFQNPQMVVQNFGYNDGAGGWRVDQHPRFLADITGNGHADIIGFGNDGVWISMNNGDGTFQNPQMAIQNYFGYNDNAGGWRVDQHPRLLADMTGDGKADIVGFGNDGVWVSFSNGDGTFQNPQLVVENFSYSVNGGGWRVDQHPRFLANITGDGKADIVGFGNDGVWIYLSA